ncbi:hypothetical protein BSIN_3801 [Burkholderia singularis]|uniref:Uncharacterized protein n=1 Tax=Burkholderia singularis TaxID=1503053 RepID=A0A238H5Z3_9BURK|nr:hypothetical protein BSIN_3801 [Burkholderia singularis]
MIACGYAANFMLPGAVAGRAVPASVPNGGRIKSIKTKLLTDA